MGGKTLVRLKRPDLEAAGIPLSPSTLYKWHSNGKYPYIFTKVGGSLYVVLSEWNRLVERNRGKIRRGRRRR